MTPYKLVIVESPAKAHTIGKFLGRGYKVEASYGHVRDLPKSTLGIDVDNNFEPKYITIRGKGDLLAQIKHDAKNATKVFLATDPDREGEAISWHLANTLGIDPDSACRVEFYEITGSVIKSAIKKARPINRDLVNAQQARRVLDRLLGYKLSPLLWAKVRKGLSAGRVQSVAAAMICDREEEISTFIPEEYWTVSSKLTAGKNVKFTAHYVPDGDKPSCKEDAEKIAEAIRSGEFAVTAVKSGTRKKNPAPPFTTSNLQQEAARKLGFTTVKTMQVAQQLYEGVELAEEGTVGVISYIRTDSTRVSDEAIKAVREYILENYGEEYLPEKPNEFKSRNANVQDAHEAIRPTSVLRTPDSIKASLTKDQFKLYKLIYSRFLASQMPPALYDTLAADMKSNDVTLHTSGSRMHFPGFTVVYEEGVDDANVEENDGMPALSEGDKLKVLDVNSDQHFTQPPPRYTEASLVHALEVEGIGRPSTYAPTITTIITRGYVAKEQKRLVPTELGMVVNDVMKQHFADIIDKTYTAGMETRLDAVETGDIEWHSIVADFYEPFSRMLEQAESTIEKVELAPKVSDVKCEKCGAMMVYRTGRFGEFLACPNFPECRNTQTIVKYVGVDCPQCGGSIIERMSKKGRRFYGCEHYPDCSFISWERPVADKCEKCGGMMVQKFGKNGEEWHICINESCRHKVEIAAGGGTESDDK